MLSGLAMPEKIVEQQAGSLSTVTRALRELIEAKKKGHVSKPSHVANENTNVVDLMAALRNSLKGSSGRPERSAAADRPKDRTRRGPAAKPRPRGRSAA